MINWKISRLCIIAASCAAFSGSAFASTVADVEAAGSGTQSIGQAGDPTPVITAVLSVPGTHTEGSLTSKNYSSYGFLVNDGTGSLEAYGEPSDFGYTTYVPTVGDEFTGTGNYSPYHQIPELEYPFSGVSSSSSGNPVSAPAVSTIPTLDQTTLPSSIAGYLFELDDVTISDTGTGDSALTPGEAFGTSNLTLEITDSDSNSMELYYYVTSYSTPFVNLANMVIPTSGLVDMTGFMSVYPTPTPGVPEFNVVSITPVPEPASIGLLALGGLSLLARRRNAR